MQLKSFSRGVKTKEMLIDLRKNPSTVPDLFIDGEKVERVSEYKYLRTVLDDNPSFTINTDSTRNASIEFSFCKS